MVARGEFLNRCIATTMLGVGRISKAPAETHLYAAGYGALSRYNIPSLKLERQWLSPRNYMPTKIVGVIADGVQLQIMDLAKIQENAYRFEVGTGRFTLRHSFSGKGELLAHPAGGLIFTSVYTGQIQIFDGSLHLVKIIKFRGARSPVIARNNFAVLGDDGILMFDPSAHTQSLIELEGAKFLSAGGGVIQAVRGTTLITIESKGNVVKEDLEESPTFFATFQSGESIAIYGRCSLIGLRATTFSSEGKALISKRLSDDGQIVAAVQSNNGAIYLASAGCNQTYSGFSKILELDSNLIEVNRAVGSPVIIQSLMLT